MPPRLRKNENKPHIPAIPFEKCAAKTTTDGKPGTTVLNHGIHVGRVAEALVALKPECVKRLLPPRPGLPTGVHDVGKVSPGYALKYFANTVVREHAPE
ncbi:MAG TPA: hypothetical protein P5527_10045, partial [Kiritimatiellia bacterium]|nr:hypothetical protein [Kiritimatiellia bacterium]